MMVSFWGSFLAGALFFFREANFMKMEFHTRHVHRENQWIGLIGFETRRDCILAKSQDQTRSDGCTG